MSTGHGTIVKAVDRKPIRKVLAVCTSAEGLEGLLAATIAMADRHDARVSMLVCIEPPSDLAAIARATGLSPDDTAMRLAEDRRTALINSAKAVLPGRSIDVHVAVGKIFVDVVHHVMAHKIDLVIKTAEPLSGLQRFLFASTDQHLLRKCPCPVWLRMPSDNAEPGSILAAVDVDEFDASEPATLDDVNRRVLDVAVQLSAGPDTTIHVLHAWDAPGEDLVRTWTSGPEPRAAAESYVRQTENERWAALSRLTAPFETRARDGDGPTIHPMLVRGEARNIIPERLKMLNIDTLVIGTVARTGLEGVIIGNTAEDILNSIEASVVAVKPSGFVSPVAVR